MILLSINIRGVGGPLKQTSMKRIIEQTQTSIIFLQETLVEATVARNFMHSTSSEMALLCVKLSGNSSGGLLVTWDPAAFILSSMLSPGGILLTGKKSGTESIYQPTKHVYGPCTGRKDFWQRLDDLGLSSG
jgi:hypothetical protein